MWIRERLADTGTTQAELGAAIGLTGVQINKILQGTRGIKAAEADSIRRFFHAGNDNAPARVENGHPAPTNTKLVPVFDVAASAGPGSFNEYESIAYSLAFPRQYIERQLRASSKDLSIISVNGFSMMPTLLHDDIVMIDRSKTNTDYDGLFVFRFGDALHIKRVTRAPDPSRFIAVSDNRADYHPIEYAKGEVEVIGRVIWYGRKV